MSEKETDVSPPQGIEKEKIAQIGEWSVSRTGQRQVTGFNDTDKAVARYINGLFNGAVIVDPRPEELRTVSFLEREPKERVYMGRFDSAIEFLKAKRRASLGVGRVPPINGDINPDHLPVVNVSRSLDVSYSNTDQQSDRRRGSMLADPDTGMPLAELEFTQSILTYDLTIIAAERQTISLLCNILGASVRLKLGTQFEAITPLVRVPVPLTCAVIDAKELGFTDVSPSLTEDRLFAVQAPFSVNAEVAIAWELDAVRRKTDIYAGVKSDG